MKKPLHRDKLKTRRLAILLGGLVLSGVVVGVGIVTHGYHVPQWVSPAAVTPPVKTSGDSVPIVAVGDLSCEPDNPYYNDGEGSNGVCQAKATSDLALSLHPVDVLTIGDEQYRNGILSDFENSYAKTWGRLKSITKPVPGNHEYNSTGAFGYYDYFGKAAGIRELGYYSYNIGDWHVVALNANCANVGGCEQTSAEEQWLRLDLAANKRLCTLAYWHQPRFSSGGHGSDAAYQPFWQDLQDYHADVVLSGHDHDYERFAPQRADGVADPNGITEFVVGTGGESLTPFYAIRANSQVRDNKDYGVLKMDLSKTSYDWQFVTTSGVVKDAGSADCVTKPAKSAAPTPIATPQPTP